jgi:hypothetical protein
MDDPWQEIADELEESRQVHVAFLSTETLPRARRLGEKLHRLQGQYDKNADFLAEAEARVDLKKTQVYECIRVFEGWALVQGEIDAGRPIESLRAASRLIAQSRATKKLKSADPGADAEDGDHTGAECPLQAPAAVVSGDGGVDAPAATKGPTTPALTALAALPAACSQLMSEVPTDRGDLVEALQKLTADAAALVRRIQAAMAAAVVVAPVEVCQIELDAGDIAGVDPTDQLLADALGLDAGDIAAGGAPEVAADSTGGKTKKGGSNRGVVTNRFPVTPEGNAAFHAELA